MRTFAVVATVAALVVAAVALLPRGDVPRATLEVSTVTAAAPPETVAPRVVPSTASGGEAAPGGTAATAPVEAASTADGGASQSGTRLSPLAALLGARGSAIPTQRVKPRSLTIDAIELWAPIRAVGLEPDGELEVPDETEVGWYELGAAPGEPGATVLAAHVTWNGSIGPFLRLGELEPGARIDVRLDDGSLRTYRVVERTMYRKDALPADRVWRTTGDETLVLITCGGSFDRSVRRYRDNIVVYAVPVA